MASPQPASPPRPWWAAALCGFCLLTLAFTIPRDLLYPAARNVEVWFGFELRGSAARMTAPLHWGIFGLFAWGFAQQRPWIWPWASVYVFYVGASHLVWSVVSPNGQGWPMGLLQATGISLAGALLLRARPAPPRHP